MKPCRLRVVESGPTWRPDRQLVLSLVKDIEIVGEAAAQVTGPTRLQTPEIPWQSIVAMRNRLVHAYFNINLDIVWQTVQNDRQCLSRSSKVPCHDRTRDRGRRRNEFEPTPASDTCLRRDSWVPSCDVEL